MAKNTERETVTYLRKDGSFFKDGVWYITTPCAKCGLVDEEVTWDLAKTPHHAGVIADQRHSKCAAADNDHEIYLSGLQEIQAAEDLCEQQVQNLKAARTEAEKWGAIVAVNENNAMYHKMLEASVKNLKRHEKGMLEAEKRVANTRSDNSR